MASGYRDPVAERYDRDPAFHNLVDMLHSSILKHQFSPTEMREALMHATLRYELLNNRSFIYTLDGEPLNDRKRF